MTKIAIITADKYLAISGKDIKWSEISSEYPPSCHLVKYEDFGINATPVTLVFGFKALSKYRVILKIRDVNTVLRKRSLRSQSNDYVGPPIEITDLSSSVYKRFFLTLKQKIRLEDGPGIECKNYPYKEFSTYQECDERFVQNKMASFSFMPFWAASSLKEVTNLT